MRTQRWLIVAMSLCIAGLGHARSQDLPRFPRATPPSVPSPPPPPTPTEILTNAPPGPSVSPATLDDIRPLRPQEPGQQHFVQLSLSVFQPTTARVAFKVWPRENGSLWLEVFGGSALVHWQYGFGGRLQYTALEFGQGDRLMISPGLGVHILPDWRYEAVVRYRHAFYSWDTWYYEHEKRNSLWFLAADVDISWLHDFSPRFGIELGLKLGLAGRIAGKVGDDYPEPLMYGRHAYPIIALFSGFRF